MFVGYYNKNPYDKLNESKLKTVKFNVEKLNANLSTETCWWYNMMFELVGMFLKINLKISFILFKLPEVIVVIYLAMNYITCLVRSLLIKLLGCFLFNLLNINSTVIFYQTHLNRNKSKIINFKWFSPLSSSTYGLSRCKILTLPLYAGPNELRKLISNQ